MPLDLISSACFLMKFISGGSSASAARVKRSSRRFTTFWKLSLKIPDMFAMTSILGRPSSLRGISSKRATLPVLSLSVLAPTKCKTMATASPLVLMESRPQRATAQVSGYSPSFCSWCCAMISLAAEVPLRKAAWDGILYGSRAWMFLPVGRTPGPSLSRSPPATEGMYSPRRARTTLFISSVFFSSRPLISSAVSTSSRHSRWPLAVPPNLSTIWSAVALPLPSSQMNASTASGNREPKYALRYLDMDSWSGALPMTCRPSENSLFSTTLRYVNSRST
mmetsp:Transcript_688/g.2035  ORF Transcript_688/g.2035 Transcript_688/m.2035 type:complete len:279 (-) Transcript_688:1219-2055(-)